MIRFTDDFCRCKYCKNYSVPDGCQCGCEPYDNYDPDGYRIIEKAKELDISVGDLLALIALRSH